MADATGTLTIQSAQSRIHQSTESEQRNASIGVSAGLGLQGFTVQRLGRVRERGFGHRGGDECERPAVGGRDGDAEVRQDTTVAGARVEGAQVVADADLKVESRQDTASGWGLRL